mgnify:CR=1 FL=1|jgi:hypothetical protein
MSETKICKHCKTEIDKKAKVCPNCNHKQGGKAKFIVIGVLVFFILIGAFSNNDDGDQDTTGQVTSIDSDNGIEKVEAEITAEPTAKPTKEETAEPTDEPTPEPTSEPEKEETPKLTMGQKNALSKAKDYLDFAAFSRSGLIEQLEFEGFSNEDAAYAVDNCGADWNEQAAIKAQDYLDFSSFSRSGLIEQLEFEGFTTEQAEYGVKEVGY